MVQSKPTPKLVYLPLTNPLSPQQPHWTPNTDVFIAPSGVLIVCLELSGMQLGDFQISTERNKLRITGKRPSSGVATAQDVLVHEINAGPFDCVLEIPPGFDLLRASSTCVNGSLRITVPRASNPS